VRVCVCARVCGQDNVTLAQFNTFVLNCGVKLCLDEVVGVCVCVCVCVWVCVGACLCACVRVRVCAW